MSGEIARLYVPKPEKGRAHKRCWLETHDKHVMRPLRDDIVVIVWCMDCNEIAMWLEDQEETIDVEHK